MSLIKEPTNSANLITLRERPWYHCPKHDEYIGVPDMVTWCSSCGAEARYEAWSAEQAYREDVKQLVWLLREMKETWSSTEAVQPLDSPPHSVIR